MSELCPKCPNKMSLSKEELLKKNTMTISYQNNMKQIIDANETVHPNSELLNSLKINLPQFFDAEGNFKVDKFADELKANNIQEARDGYRLSFVGKDYARLQTGRDSETMIMPDAEHNSKSENADSQNVFITGDNLEALRHLQNAYLGKVKMIYIDPPYNTGKEFVYNDHFEFSDEKLQSALGYSNEEIARLKTIQGKSSHSAWLTFMYPRLKLAQKLLTNDGVIFVSIDDNEQANLKLLMDEVFGEGNFVAEFIWKSRQNKDNRNTTGVSVDHEYIVCYSKSNIHRALKGSKRKIEQYTNTDNDPRGDWASGNMVGLLSEELRPNCHYDLINPATGINYSKPKMGWRYDKKTMAKLITENRIIWPLESTGRPRRKVFLSELNDSLAGFCSIVGENIFTRNGTIEIEELFGGRYFDFPKPTQIIREMIEQSIETDSIILDFFAGSATTAHAVMQLNAEDGGNRKFIMVQLDEQTNPDSEAKNAGYNTIDEISRERIKRAAAKIKFENPLFAENLDLGFKHYRLTSPTEDTLDKIIEFNPTQPREQELFENMIDKLGGLETILATWLIDDGYDFSQSAQTIDFAGYTAHYIDNSVLYLVSQGWGVEQTKMLLNKIGKHELNVNTIIVFGYSFMMESLRELEMNVKNTLDKQVLIEKRY